MQQSVNCEPLTREPTVNGPFFSIIIPVYNVAPYLRECLDSVLAQTFGDWECLCVDDGSTDESSTILDEYAQKDARFRIFHKTNGGVSVARNLALDNAKGEYIAFLDGDDSLKCSLLDKVAQFIAKEHAEVIRYDYIKFKEDCNLLRSSSLDRMTCSLLLETEKIKAEMLDACVKSGYVWRLCIQKNLIDRHGIRFPINVKCEEDALFILRVCFYAKSVLRTDYIGYNYRDREGSAVGMFFSSLERMFFLKNFREIVNLYGATPILSKWGWMAIVAWMVKPKDVTFQKELHQLFKEMRDQKIILFKHLPLYSRPLEWSYVMFNCKWVTRYAYLFIGFCWKACYFLRKVQNNCKGGAR